MCVATRRDSSRNQEFTREGIITGFKARHTCAATDKIFVELSCGDHLMGEVFETDKKPVLTFQIFGTAPLKRVTIFRRAVAMARKAEPKKSVSGSWADASPVAGENRYYLRIEQKDGNMAWSSPLWITVRDSGQ